MLAVAGSGKTTSIVRRLRDGRPSLVITYTENNLANLRRKIIKEFGVFPKHVTLSSYFTFLYSFCFRPFLWRDTRPRGMRWGMPPQWTRTKRRDNRLYYFDEKRRVYHNRLAKLLEMENVLGQVQARIEKYFDALLIDEVQDFAGHDFNLLSQLASSHVDMCLVGDFFQHTYDTSRDGNVNKNLHQSLDAFVTRLERIGFSVDKQTLERSYRCSPTLCSFVKDNLGIVMTSHRKNATDIRWVTCQEEATRIQDANEVVKLFYQSHQKYRCRSCNWGASKGDDYQDIAVALNTATLRKLEKGKGHELKPQTRNKLYVACTRAWNSVYLIPERLMTSHAN
ncbi:MAG: UvrD-helicase domain-containing protein [Candidatus Eisenbacteria sp.]|nr:UvrD-helicase domain-containing protein [Candidatus Eisenbacteria bacterium]